MFIKCLTTALAMLFAASNGFGQLTSGDSLFIRHLNTTCELNAFQRSAVDTLMKSTAIQLKQLDKELSKVSRSSISDEEKNIR
ncbi:MAG: hypothetical protein ACKO7B_20545, partial [Flavobacteriales bacterium]